MQPIFQSDNNIHEKTKTDQTLQINERKSFHTTSLTWKGRLSQSRVAHNIGKKKG